MNPLSEQNKLSNQNIVVTEQPNAKEQNQLTTHKGFELAPYVAQHFFSYLTSEEAGQLILTNHFWYKQKKGWKIWSEIIDYNGIFERAISNPNLSLTKKNTNILLKMPQGIHHHFLNFLTVKETTYLGLMNRQWKALVDDPQVWKNIAKRFPETCNKAFNETCVNEPKYLIANLFTKGNCKYPNFTRCIFDGIENILKLPINNFDNEFINFWDFNQNKNCMKKILNKPTIFRGFTDSQDFVIIQFDLNRSMSNSSQQIEKIKGVLVFNNIYNFQSYDVTSFHDQVSCNAGFDIYHREKFIPWLKKLLNGGICGKNIFEHSSHTEISGHSIENFSQTYTLRESKAQ